MSRLHLLQLIPLHRSIAATPRWLECIIHGGFYLSAFIIRHSVLPRFKPSTWVPTGNLSAEYLSQLSPGELPRMHVP